MPQKGETLTDKLTGNTYEFIETAKDTQGTHVTIKLTLRSKGKIAPPHIHVKQDETFKVLSGKMTYIQEGKEHIVEAGETVMLPKNVPHNHFNNHDEPLVITQTISPAYDIDYFFESLVGLSSEGKVKNGNFKFLQAMVFLKHLDSPTFLDGIPLGVQRFLSNALAPIGRLLGYRALYPRFSGVEK